MKKVECDVLIVGAGPAGLATAITVSRTGLKTILVEKNSVIGYPVKTSAVTWRELWEDWGMTDKVLCQKQDSIYINSLLSKREVEINFRRVVAGSLDYPIFLRELAFKAINTKTRILLSERVVEPIFSDGSIVGVKTSKGREIYSKIVVDCSGPEAVIARRVNLIPKLKEIEIGIGMEYEMKGVKVRNQNAIDFYVSREHIVPVGYGWCFPLGHDSARIGICTVNNTQEEIEERGINVWLDRFIEENEVILKMVKDAQPYEIHMGVYPLCGVIEKPYHDGLLVVGDAAAHASMLMGEGIRYAMEFGRRAGEVIIDAIKKRDYSEKVLGCYKGRCQEYLGETYEVAMDLLQVPTDEYWETLVDNIIRLKKQGDYELILKYFKTAMSYEDAKIIFPTFNQKYFK